MTLLQTLGFQSKQPVQPSAIVPTSSAVAASNSNATSSQNNISKPSSLQLVQALRANILPSKQETATSEKQAPSTPETNQKTPVLSIVKKPETPTQDNVIELSGEITMESAHKLKNDLLKMASRMTFPDGSINHQEMEKNPIKISISSPGGVNFGLNEILDTMDQLKEKGFKIETYSNLAASAAAVIAANGTPGHRYISPRGTYMVHQVQISQPLGSSSLVDIEHRMKLSQQLNNVMFETLSKGSNGRYTKDELLAKTDRDWFMHGKEAIEAGFIDKIGGIEFNPQDKKEEKASSKTPPEPVQIPEIPKIPGITEPPLLPGIPEIPAAETPNSSPSET